MSYLDSTTNSSNSVTGKSVAVPVGVAADTIVILAVTCDTLANFDSGHWPTGFVEIAELDITHDNQTSAVAWKRATGADSGTYDFISAPGGSNWVVQALALNGRHTTNPPTGSSAQSNAGNASPITVSAATVTALDGDDLVWISTPDVNGNGIGNGHTAPPGYTKREDDENAFSNMCMATKENVAAGATGSVDGTFALTGGTAGWGAYLIRVPALPSGVVNSSTLSSTVSVTDEGLDYVFFNRLLESTVNLFDALVASVVFSGASIQTKVLESLIVATDGAIASQIRNRLLQDTIIVTEGATELYINTNILAEDVIELSDGLAAFCRFFRLGSDAVTVADSLISSVINYLIVARVLSSNVDVTDEVVRSFCFMRFAESFLTIFDEALTPMQRFILLTDTLSVDDEAIALYTQDGTTPGQVFDPVVRIGFDQPRIDIGGYAVN